MGETWAEKIAGGGVVELVVGAYDLRGAERGAFGLVRVICFRCGDLGLANRFLEERAIMTHQEI